MLSTCNNYRYDEYLFFVLFTRIDNIFWKWFFIVFLQLHSFSFSFKRKISTKFAILLINFISGQSRFLLRLHDNARKERWFQRGQISHERDRLSVLSELVERWNAKSWLVRSKSKIVISERDDRSKTMESNHFVDWIRLDNSVLRSIVRSLPRKRSPRIDESHQFLNDLEISRKLILPRNSFDR